MKTRPYLPWNSCKVCSGKTSVYMYDNSSFWKRKCRFWKRKTWSLWWCKTLHFGKTKSSWCDLHYSLFQELGEHRPIRRHFGFQFVSFTERNGYHHKEICVFYLAFPTLALSYGSHALLWLVGCLVGENIALFALICADRPVFTMVILSY